MNRINIQSLIFVLGLVSCGGVSASAMRDCTVTCDSTTDKCEGMLQQQLKSSSELSKLRASIVDIMAPMQGHLQGLKAKYAAPSRGFFSSLFRGSTQNQKELICEDLRACHFYTPFKERLVGLFQDRRFNASVLKYAGPNDMFGDDRSVWVECDDKKDPIWALGELPFDNMKALVKSSALAPVHSCNVFNFPRSFSSTGQDSLSDFIDTSAKRGFEARIAIDPQDQSKFLVQIQNQGRGRY